MLPTIMICIQILKIQGGEIRMRMDGLFVPCPVCGKITCRISYLSQIEIKCPKCRSELLAEIGKEQRITVEVLKDGLSLGA